MKSLYDNSKKSRLTNTTKEDSIYSVKFYTLNKQIEQLQNEKQQLISFLEDKIKEYDEKINTFYEKYIDKNCSNLESKLEAFQEVLDFVTKGGKDE